MKRKWKIPEGKFDAHKIRRLREMYEGLNRQERRGFENFEQWQFQYAYLLNVRQRGEMVSIYDDIVGEARELDKTGMYSELVYRVDKLKRDIEESKNNGVKVSLRERMRYPVLEGLLKKRDAEEPRPYRFGFFAGFFQRIWPLGS